MKRWYLPLLVTLLIAGSMLPLYAGKPAGDREVVVGKDAPPPAEDQLGDANPGEANPGYLDGGPPPVITDNYLGQTYKLTFQLLPRDEKDKSWSVVTANPKYALSMAMQQQGAEYRVALTGEVGVLDDKPDALLVGFTVHLDMRTPDSKAKLQASGSRLVSLGKPTILAELGDKTLQVTVSKVE